jgi:hypothetical protein
MGFMKPPPTDINLLPHRWRNLVPLTGLTAHIRRMHAAETNARVEHVTARLKD